MHKIYGFLSSFLVFLLKVIMFRKITLDIWSIKVFVSDSFISKPINEKLLKNPSIQAREVTDVNAEFIADPFIISDRERIYMFFEVLDKSTRKGVIGLATSDNGEKWCYEKIVLEESYHLSYPYVFKMNDNYYMIPESSEAKGVFLYKANNFPYEWENVYKLIDGQYVDPSIFTHNNKWWLYASQCDKLYLFYSEELFGEWKEHSKSPLLKENSNITRPGGRVIKNEGEIYRYAQDCQPFYGSSVRILKISKLSELEYEEEELNLVLNGSKKESDWNKDGMHSIDQLRETNGKWLIAVDGHRREKRNYFLWKIESIVSKVTKLKLFIFPTLFFSIELEQLNIDVSCLYLLINNGLVLSNYI